jgi:hypothetical protein
MFSINSSNPSNLSVQKNTAIPSKPSEIDTKDAKKAYLLATENPEEHHAAVGILLPNGKPIEMNLGKDEDYGAHRVGSVTKTFTTLCMSFSTFCLNSAVLLRYSSRLPCPILFNSSAESCCKAFILLAKSLSFTL